MQERKKYHIFCDESCLTHRYACYGGIIIPDRNINIFNETIEKSRIEQNLFAEIKWTKISDQYYSKYNELISTVSSLINKDLCHFRSMIVDTNTVNNKKFNNGDRELGIYKHFYCLLIHCFLKDMKNCDFEIYIDSRTTSYDLNNLQTIINNTLKSSKVTSIKHIDSKKSNFIQINDLLLGSLSFHKNGQHLISGTKKSKINISKNIATLFLGVSYLGNCTDFLQKRFKIWNFKYTESR